MTRKRRTKATDPLLRACTACGALAGQGCRTVLVAEGKSLTLVSFATRLVHAVRIEQPQQESRNA